jgi:hypothetical protein
VRLTFYSLFNIFENMFVSDGSVTARGCSTKDKIFHIKCENHVMGRNNGVQTAVNVWVLVSSRVIVKRIST